MLPSVRRLFTLSALLLLTAGSSAAFAQEEIDPERQPIGRFVADVRGVFARYPDDPVVATFLDVTKDNLATRGLGLALGAHVYPLRLGKITLGFGGEMLVSRGRKTVTTEPEKEDEEEIEGPTVTARLSAISPQVSLNFGRRDGWSYLSGGLGWTKYSTTVHHPEETTTGATADAGGSSRTQTLNYGGGARWFAKKHLAFNFDVRFYRINPQEPTATRPALPRKRLVYLSAGISFR